MKPETFRKIIELNKDFYNEIGQSFSSKRQYPWEGWGRVVVHIKTLLDEKDTIKVLDLGCGNGRFYDYLASNLTTNKFEYTGCDISEPLLSISKSKYPNTEFLQLDIISDLEKIHEKYDVVACFGITHHIPSFEFRKKWFEKLSKLVESKGLLILTFWEFNNDKRFSKSSRNITSGSVKIGENDIEEGDYFLGWDKKNNAFRYVHIYSEEEYKLLDSLLIREKLHFEDTYRSDGKSDLLNLYKIYKKIT
ncbi:class I SAM-dependent methyltransferase [Patescibacteria group bacterium]|nr:class I SAM-dependent methyltransferase [Patescibacteria group bacterium]